jgi:hypothetical protein
MKKSENNPKNTNENDDSIESKPLPNPTDKNEQNLPTDHHKSALNTLRVDTSATMGTPVQSQNTGSQRISSVKNRPASIMSSSARTLHQQHQSIPSTQSKRSEIPTDTRPERSQRPEDLKRARYLTTAITKDDTAKDEKSAPKKVIKRKPPTCWVTTSWILTWWAPPFMLRTFGKSNSNRYILNAY